jgi:hypothetical protein
MFATKRMFGILTMFAIPTMFLIPTNAVIPTEDFSPSGEPALSEVEGDVLFFPCRNIPPRVIHPSLR